MRVLGTSTEISRALTDLLRRYQSYSWAVAWASAGFPAAELLLKKRGHIKRLVVGTHIPVDGDVHQEHFQDFTRKFESAFSDLSRGGGGVATATRLLAMKRPDYFICLDSRNRERLCKAFGIPISLGLDRYWDSLVERITGAAWWSADKPDDRREQDVWMGRAAFLDALYYEQ